MNRFKALSTQDKIKNISLILLMLIILVTGSLSSVVLSILKDAPLTPVENLSYTFAQTSSVYDKNGALIENVEGSESRVIVSIDEVPKDVINAFIAIEDQNFYDHHGIDLRNILASLHTNFQSGRIVRGGSTLTQQLVKNVFLDQDQNIKRKLQEAYLSMRIEREMSKDEILEAYLNGINFGQGAYGLQAASEHYFAKDVSELTLAEGAVLAAIAKSPVSYQPYYLIEQSELTDGDAKILGTVEDHGVQLLQVENPNSVQRKELILHVMEQNGYISKKEANQALQQEIVYHQRESEGLNLSPYSVDYVLDEAAQILSELKNIPETEARLDVISGGYKIHSTLDTELQKNLEELYVQFDDLLTNYSSRHLLSYKRDEDNNILDVFGNVLYYNRGNLYNDQFDLILSKDQYDLKKNGDLSIWGNFFDVKDGKIHLKDTYVEPTKGRLRIYPMDQLAIPDNYFIGRDQVLTISAEFINEHPDFYTLNDDQLIISNHYLLYNPSPVLQPQTATVILNNHDGSIQAIVGGLDVTSQSKRILNRTKSLRQPGTALTPFTVYMTAIDHKIPLNKVYDDVPNQFEGNYWPENRDGRYMGNLTLGESFLSHRDTIPSLVVQELGIDASLETLKNLGLYTKDKESILIDEKANPKRNDMTLDALSQGNLTGGMSLLNLASSYQLIANEGKHASAHVVQSIEDPQGNIIYETKIKPERIESPESNYLLAQLLQKNTKRYPLNQIGRKEWMGVLGTNKYQSDQIIIGSTPNYTIGSWIGPDSPMIKFKGSSQVSIDWYDRLLKLIEDDGEFNAPPSKIVEQTICKKSGLLASKSCQVGGDAMKEAFIAGTEPTDYCKQHTSRLICTASNQLANQYCPKNNLVYRAYFIRSGEYNSQEHNNIYPEDMVQIPGSYCSIHTEEWYQEELEAYEKYLKDLESNQTKKTNRR